MISLLIRKQEEKMRYRQFIVSSMTLFYSLLAQDATATRSFTEFNLPNYMINNQLADIYYVEYGGLAIANGEFVPSEGEIENRFARLNTITFNGLPIQLINTRPAQLYLGFGYERKNFTTFDQPIRMPDRDLHKVQFSFFWDQQLYERFYLFSYAQVFASGDDPFARLDRSTGMFILEKVNYRFHRQMLAGLGVFYNSNLGDAVILPAIAFAISGDNYVLDLDFPNKLEAEWLLDNGKYRPTIGLTFPFGSYHLREENVNLTYLGTSAYVGIKYQVMSILYAHLMYHYNFSENYAFGPKGAVKDIGDLRDNSAIILGLRFQVARFIPFIFGY
jgi:hypothetical protein